MTSTHGSPGTDAVTQGAGKREWAKPGITTFEAIAVTKGAGVALGEGVNNAVS